MERPITTLFMLMSLDGKISSGETDEFDVDKDFKNINGVKEGLYQYYEIEKTTDLWSLNTGRVMEKIGVNIKNDKPNKTPVSFVIVDRKPHLNENGISYILDWVRDLYIVTNNKNHPAFRLKNNNLHIMYFEKNIDLEECLIRLKKEQNVERITIQSGGTLNGEFLRKNIIDYVDIIIAPVLVGGKNVSTLIDGTSIHTKDELHNLKSLILIECSTLEGSYVRLKYKVNN